MERVGATQGGVYGWGFCCRRPVLKRIFDIGNAAPWRGYCVRLALKVDSF